MNNSNPSTSEALRQMMRRDVVNKTSKPEPIKSVPTYATVEEAKRSVVPAPPTGDPTPIAEQAQTQAPKQGIYSQMYSQLFNNQQPESPEEIAKREKREKTRQTIANLSDSLAHVANVWGAIKGGTPAKLSSLSDANRRRYEYANKQRLENTDAWQRGMFKAQTLDMQNEKQDAIFKAQQEAAQRKLDFETKKAEQERALKELEFTFKKQQAAIQNQFEADKLRGQQEYQQGMLGVAKTNAESNRVRANAYSNKTTGTGTDKMMQFAMSDGSVVEVPDALKNDFYAEMYDYIATTATNQGIELPFIDYKNDMTVSKASHMRDAVHSYYKRVDGGEEKLRELAKRYNNNIENISQSDEEENIGPIMQAVEDLIPNM